MNDRPRLTSPSTSRYPEYFELCSGIKPKETFKNIVAFDPAIQASIQKMKENFRHNEEWKDTVVPLGGCAF